MALAVSVFHLGLAAGRSLGEAIAAPLAIVGLWQLSQFCLSKRCGVCFEPVLTPEQVREFEGIIRALSEYKDIFPSVRDLGQVEGGFAAIKQLPAIVSKIRVDLDNYRRAQIGRNLAQPTGPGQVSERCAEYLGAIAITLGEKTGKLEQLEPTLRRNILSRSESIFGAAVYRSSLTSSDIPLPTEYSGEVVQLVSQYGSARRYGTVLPLGAGTLKLPKLKTDPAFGLISPSGTVGQKSPQTEWVTFNAEKFGGLIQLPSEISEDSIVGIGQFIANYSARNIALVEDQVFFLNLDGSTYGAVKGLCGSTITNSKVTQMTTTKTHYSDATLANLRTLRTVPDAAALRVGAYYCHPTFEALFSSLNSSGDKPYNPQAQIQGNNAQPFLIGPTLDGFPIRWVDMMPAYSTSVNASKVFMLFGDLSYQYFTPRGQIRFDTSKEFAFDTDELAIRALERFTIGLMANGAVGGLETAAS